jgi:proteasome lid subunit RPN8/RPN11
MTGSRKGALKAWRKIRSEQYPPSAASVLHLEKEARLLMVFAAIEAYKSETLGLILGYRTRKCAVARLAIPYQTAKRRQKFSSVEPPGKEPRLLGLSKQGELPDANMEILGYFHSHPNWGRGRNDVRYPTPSKDDVQSTQDGDYELIIEMREGDRRTQLRHKNGILSGSFGKFQYNMRGYYKIKGKLRIIALTTETEGKYVSLVRSDS